jgi:chromosome segregation protein
LVDHLRVVEKQITEIDQQISAQEQQRIQTQQNLSQQETIYRRLLLESQRARDAAETLHVQLQEELGISDPKELTSRAEGQAEVINRVGGQTDAINRVPTSSPGKSGSVSSKHAGVTNAGETDDLSSQEEAQLKRYRRRIEILRNRLKVMGGCDMNAPQLYEETKTRYDFLSSQITDMDQATSQLHSIIEQLDLTMARQFELTFQAVNTRFREHFTTLFNGGTARLELVAAKSSNEVSPAPSSMPSGVEVIVQPPGKKVQDLSLLSGGERALVSAALLFSLLEINPPPFCLLDEVDAALDESNVTRFCDILKRLAQQTQFIVITHNRVTMSAAQVIYGTSMRESVSRMLSLRLEEAAVAGDR